MKTSKPFVSCRLSGRIGNNVFQIMTAIAHAKRNNCDYKIPSFVKSKYTKKNPFDLFTELTPEDEKRIEYEHYQDGWTFEPIPYKPNMRIAGWYQNYNYFHEYRKELIELFNLPKEKIDAVAVHVRRGDYRRYPTKWPMLPKVYYDKANWIRNGEFYDVPVHVFSDEELNDDHGGAEKYFIAGDPLEDWIRMTQYKYFIIANSTYSLTAAYLSGSDNVIAPHHTQWYGKDNSHLYTGELLIPEWKQIKF